MISKRIKLIYHESFDKIAQQIENCCECREECQYCCDICDECKKLCCKQCSTKATSIETNREQEITICFNCCCEDIDEDLDIEKLNYFLKLCDKKYLDFFYQNHCSEYKKNKHKCKGQMRICDHCYNFVCENHSKTELSYYIQSWKTICKSCQKNEKE